MAIWKNRLAFELNREDIETHANPNTTISARTHIPHPLMRNYISAQEEVQTMKAGYLLLLLLAVLLFAPALSAQTWFKVAKEGSAITSAAPITVRFGIAPCDTAPQCWTTPKVVSGSFTATYTTLGDPAPYYTKELDVLEIATPQAVIVDGASIAVPALISAPTGNVTAAPVATVTTKDQTVTTSSPVIPAGTTICTIPKTGGACKTTSAITLAPLTATVPGQNTPVVFVPMTFSCPNVPIINGVPDLTQPLLDCKVAAK